MRGASYRRRAKGAARVAGDDGGREELQEGHSCLAGPERELEVKPHEASYRMQAFGEWFQFGLRLKNMSHAPKACIR